MIPTGPLRPRNRLAMLVVRALSDPAARDELTTLASGARLPASWLTTDDERAHERAIAIRARAASDALAAARVYPVRLALDDALGAAAVLFDAGLYFETHEVLEPLWRDAGGDAREALQGLIQIAVGYQHLANGNVAGARALLDEGARRVGVGALDGIDLASFARAVRISLGRVDARERVDVPPFPRADDSRRDRRRATPAEASE